METPGTEINVASGAAVAPPAPVLTLKGEPVGRKFVFDLALQEPAADGGPVAVEIFYGETSLAGQGSEALKAAGVPSVAVAPFTAPVEVTVIVAKYSTTYFFEPIAVV